MANYIKPVDNYFFYLGYKGSDFSEYDELKKPIYNPYIPMKKKYWYRFITEYCPQCGNDSTWKERIYDKPKPEKKQDRYIFKEVWDYCQ